MINAKIINRLNLDKILVVGAGGYMGQFYINSLLQLGIDKNSIIAVDTSIGNLVKVSTKYSNMICTLDINFALGVKPKIALVMVNSPVHQKVIEQCYYNGIRKFFVEKPLVYTLDQVEPLKKLNLENLYTGYLINFSEIVNDLFQFMREENLIVIQARAFWGKNWCSVNRPMGGDIEEELPHSLALILSAIEQNQRIIDIDSCINLSYIPFINPKVLEKVDMKKLGFPDKLNDSSIADFKIKTDKKNVNVHIMTSFNNYEQIRRVEISFIKDGDIFDFPKFKACLEFDVNSRDLLRIKDASTDEEIFIREFKGDKMQAQLESALKAFAGEEIDKRLVSFEQAAWLVRLIQNSNSYS